MAWSENTGGCDVDSYITENTRSGSRFEYHWFIERDEAGPVLGIKWVPSTVLKTSGNFFSFMVRCIVSDVISTR